MRVRYLPILVALATQACLLACRDGAPERTLELRDESGTLVATLSVSLPAPPPPSVPAFEGAWKLLSHTRAFPRESTRPGRYQGTYADGQLSLDLNPGMADNNVMLDGSARAGAFEGRWCLATIAGCQPRGSFRTVP